MASSNSKGMDTGTKVVIGLASVALILFFANGSPDNDAWQDDDASTDEARETGSVDPDGVDLDLDDGDDEPEPPVDDPWTRGAPSGADDGDDDEPEPPVDDPWTRGAPSGAEDGDDDESELPADDPWTRGSDADGGFGDGPSPCVGVTEFETDDGTVVLPIDRADDAFASPDCTITRGQSGGAVWLVQAALSVCNGQAVPIDGVDGEVMTQALAAVQAQHGIAVDGVYGPQTREAMAWPTEPDRDGGGPTECIPQPGVE